MTPCRLVDTRPTAWQLNPSDAVRVSANSTSITLSADGQFALYRRFGSGRTHAEIRRTRLAPALVCTHVGVGVSCTRIGHQESLNTLTISWGSSHWHRQGTVGLIDRVRVAPVWRLGSGQIAALSSLNAAGTRGCSRSPMRTSRDRDRPPDQTELTPRSEAPLYNNRGTTPVIIDVLGYCTPVSNSGGSAGHAGPARATGPVGLDGADGADGLNGVDGLNGLDGADGLNGASDVDGNTGPAGSDGLDGAPGDVGVQGAPATNGTDGVSGRETVVAHCRQ
jgi:hypothetical protein